MIARVGGSEPRRFGWSADSRLRRRFTKFYITLWTQWLSDGWGRADRLKVGSDGTGIDPSYWMDLPNFVYTRSVRLQHLFFEFDGSSVA